MDETSNSDSTAPSADQTVVEPVAAPRESTVAPASIGEPEVANVPVIQIYTPAEVPTPVASPEPEVGVSSGGGEPASASLVPFETGSAAFPLSRTGIEKEIIKEVTVEKPIDRVVERVVYKDAEITPASFRAYLSDFLHRVDPKGRAMQHERAQKKRADTLKLFDTHKEVSHKFVMDTLRFSDREASRILADLRAAGKILIHEPARHDAKTHHGGRGTFYTLA